MLNLLENKLCSLTWQITHCQSPKGSFGCSSLAGTRPHPLILLSSSLQFTFSVVWISTLKFPGGAGESEIIKGTGSSQLQEQGKVHALGRPIGWKLEGRPAKVGSSGRWRQIPSNSSQGRLPGGKALEWPGDLPVICTCRKSSGRGSGSRARVEDARRVSEEEVIRTNGMGWLRRDHIWLDWQSPLGDSAGARRNLAAKTCFCWGVRGKAVTG